MKTLIIGDIHGTHIWESIVSENPDVDSVIFMGDYFDSFDFSGTEQIYNFNKIINFKKESDLDVVMLLGNHDHHYLNVGETYSGYQPTLQFDINILLKENMSHLQIAHEVNGYLFSHAGISSVWMDDVFTEDKWSKDNVVDMVNDLYRYQPNKFNFTGGGVDMYGTSVTQTPLWIRPSGLLKSNKKNKKLKDNFIQVVGHTQEECIFKSFKNSEKSMGNKYFVVDCLPSGGYAILNDVVLTPKVLTNFEK
jgi:hypothetical protein